MFSWKKFESVKTIYLPPVIDDLFQVRKVNYDLMHFKKIANTKKNSAGMGLETITCRVP